MNTLKIVKFWILSLSKGESGFCDKHREEAYTALFGTKSSIQPLFEGSTYNDDDDDDDLERLGVDGGLDDVHHHFRRDGV